MKWMNEFGSPVKEMLDRYKKIIPGWRYFHCEDCNHTWREKCRDVESPSGSTCQKCLLDDSEGMGGHTISPVGWAYHPEWPVDKSGNLIDEGEENVS